MKKRLISIISAILITSCSSQVTGDVNQDGKLTEADVIAIKEHIKGISVLSEKQQKVADVNEDGDINIFDMIAAQKIILGK